jgi:hypothetical protein
MGPEHVMQAIVLLEDHGNTVTEESNSRVVPDQLRAGNNVRPDN